MLRPWHVWLAFLSCLFLVAIALGWLSYHAAQTDRAEAATRRMMAIEENARLALWRMDSAMASLVAQESARPYHAYKAFPLDANPWSEEQAVQQQARPAAPSSLLTELTPLVKLHFQVDAQEQLSSPQAPASNEQAQFASDIVSGSKLQRSKNELQELKKRVKLHELFSSIPQSDISLLDQDVSGSTWDSSSFGAQIPNSPPQQVAQQRSSNEYQARSQVLSGNIKAFNRLPALASIGDNRGAVMTPVWVGDELFLARKVIVEGRPVVQACWLDLPAIYKQLLDSTKDLLPAAHFVPAKPPVKERTHLLASLPLELITGEVDPYQPYLSESATPMQIALVTAWIAFALAAIAVAVLLSGVVSLSERRASFVSAVTHELRTPLTTFRLYSEMLAEGMVGDEETRAKYLQTLKVEADRLMHLVENVLAYARLERGGKERRILPVVVSEMLERVEPRLASRCEQADLELQVDVDPKAADRKVLADVGAVEQILFNLVDNACKYAASAADRTLSLSAIPLGNQLALRVRDHGPGISSKERRKLFRPFHKSAQEAAISAPGVGLGLALSRRLARALGGNLVHEQSADGTQFSLILNLADPPAID